MTGGLGGGLVPPAPLPPPIPPEAAPWPPALPSRRDVGPRAGGAGGPRGDGQPWDPEVEVRGELGVAAGSAPWAPGRRPARPCGSQGDSRAPRPPCCPCGEGAVTRRGFGLSQRARMALLRALCVRGARAGRRGTPGRCCAPGSAP